MKEGSDGFVRADQIDLKTIDEQLERHLNKALILEKHKNKEEDDATPASPNIPTTTFTRSLSSRGGGGGVANFKRQKYEWEIEPSKLIIKSVIARGTFGTVHRGIYDGQDVAGWSHLPTLFLLILFSS